MVFTLIRFAVGIRAYQTVFYIRVLTFWHVMIMMYSVFLCLAKPFCFY